MPPDPRPFPLSPRTQVLLVGIVFLGLYLALPTAAWSYDAIGYVGFIHQASYLTFGPGAWHEYHMLYMPLGAALGRALVALGFLPDVLVMMQIVNALFSAVTLAIFYAVLRSETGRGSIALAATGLLGFANAWWYYATDPEVYPPCLLFLLLAWIGARRFAATRRALPAALAGFCLGLAFGFHLAAVVIIPALIVMMMAPGDRPAQRARGVLLLGVVAVAIGLAPYAFKYHVQDGTTLVQGLAGLLQRGATRRSEAGEAWLLGSGYHPWVELRGTLAAFAPGPSGGGGVLSAASAILRWLLAAMFAGVALQAPSLWRRHRVAALGLSVWCVTSFLFFTAYNVGSAKFVSFHLLPFFLLAGLAASRPEDGPSARWTGRAGIALAIVLALVNGGSRALPESRTGNNPDYRRALFVHDHTGEADLVIHAGAGENIMQKVYLPYFAGRQGVPIDLLLRSGRPTAEILDALDARIRDCAARGGRVFVLGNLLDDEELRQEIEERHHLAPGTLTTFFARYERRPHAQLDPSFRIYEIRVPPVETGEKPRPHES